MKKIYFAIFILFVSIQAGCSAPDNVTITKDVPITVENGQLFDFTINVHNQNDVSHELRSIDIDQTFLEGIYVASTTPPTVEEWDTFGQDIFEFQADIDQNATKEVIFHAKAVKPGDFSGDLDVCIDGDASCLFNSIRIIVNE